MNTQQTELTDWIIGTLGIDSHTACAVACSYDSDELEEDIEYIKKELVSWKNRNDMLLGMGIFKKI